MEEREDRKNGKTERPNRVGYTAELQGGNSDTLYRATGV